MDHEPVRTFVLDTDIGTDVDDILALAVALGSPELAIGAVTTVYGDVRLRARVAMHAFAAAGVAPPPVVPGIELPRSGRPVWWPGHEGGNLPAGNSFEPSALDAIEVLATATVVAGIGPLTNVAAALERPGCAIEQIVLMAGEFRDEVIEHNILSDVSAAEVVFASGRPVTVVGLDQTERLQITEETLGRIGTESPLGALLQAEVRDFWAFLERDFNVPHDPIAILALARPDLFETEHGLVQVGTHGPQAGLTTFEPRARGPHEVIVGFDLDGVAEEIVERLSRATALSGLPSPKETAQ